MEVSNWFSVTRTSPAKKSDNETWLRFAKSRVITSEEARRSTIGRRTRIQRQRLAASDRRRQHAAAVEGAQFAGPFVRAAVNLRSVDPVSQLGHLP